jgi:hypothetical protein
MKEVLEKKLKFNQEKLKRAIKNFFISNRHWYHDDLEKLNHQLPYINLLRSHQHHFLWGYIGGSSLP